MKMIKAERKRWTRGGGGRMKGRAFYSNPFRVRVRKGGGPEVGGPVKQLIIHAERHVVNHQTPVTKRCVTVLAIDREHPHSMTLALV